MREFEIYLPSQQADGAEISPAEIEKIKKQLAEAFGGYTHLLQRGEGAWKMGGVTFYDEITILRVLDDGSSEFDMRAFRKKMESALQQEQVLVLERDVKVV